MSVHVEEADVTNNAAQIVAAFVANNQIEASEVPTLVTSVMGALRGAHVPPEPEVVPPEPAVPVKKSITKKQIFCLECGKGFSMLRRHLRSDHGMTPDEYKAKFSLSADYPLVASDYSAARSSLAKQFGLGRGGSAAT